MGEKVLSRGHIWRNHILVPDFMVLELVVTDIGRGHWRCGSYIRLWISSGLKNRV